LLLHLASIINKQGRAGRIGREVLAQKRRSQVQFCNTAKSSSTGPFNDPQQIRATSGAEIPGGPR